MPKKKPGVYTAKNGAKYRILPNGRARFITGPTKKKGKKKKGGGLGLAKRIPQTAKDVANFMLY